jgi:FAD synthetase
MKTVLVFGTFDLMHPGHVSFLRQARKKGDRLVVSVARDRFVEIQKGRSPVHGEDERLRRVLDSGLVDEAVLSDEEAGSYGVVRRYAPQVICFGHDQRALESHLKNWLTDRRIHAETYTLEAYRPDRYKTSRYHPGGGSDTSETDARSR